MREQNERWGELLFLGALAVGLIAYLVEAGSASTRIDNLILIAPGVCLALFFVAVIATRIMLTRHRAAAEGGQKRAPDETASRPAMPTRDIAAYLATFFAIAPLTVYAGFDVAVFVFILAATWLNGERRTWVLVAFALGFTVVVIGGFSAILSVPVPTLWSRLS